MALSTGASCLKFLLFFFNSIVFIAGAVISGFGIYMVVQAKEAIGSQAIAIPAFILAIGLILFVLGFLGCVGACKQSVCMLKTFAILVGILLLLEIIAGILIFVYRHSFKDTAAKVIAKQISLAPSWPKDQREAFLKGMDSIQKELKCCGGNSSQDWSPKVPPSCCEKETSPCKNPFKLGCAQALYDHLKNKWAALAITIIVLGIIQIGAIVAACCLAKSVQSYTSV